MTTQLTTIAPYEYANVDLADQLQRLQESSDPWQRCMGAYLQEAHTRSGSWATVRAYAINLQVFFSRIHKPLDLVTREDVWRFLQSPCRRGPREGQPPSVSTHNGRLTAVHGLYDFASTYTVTGPDGQPTPLFDRANPAGRIAYGKVARSYHVLTADELTRLFAQIDRSTPIGKRDYALFLLYFLSARRSQEILQLRWQDLQPAIFTENGITRQGWTFRFYGKGHKRQEDRQELPALAKAALDDWLEASGRLPLTPDDFLWTATPSPRGRPIIDPYKPVGRETIAHRLKLYARMAGLSDGLSSHWLRHSSARLRLENGATLQEVQHVLRHSSLAVTDIYVRQIVTPADPGASKLERLAFLAR